MKMHRRFLAVLVMGILLCSIWTGMGVRAGAEEDNFVIDAQIQASDEPVFDVRLTIENLGGDWEGLVRLEIAYTYGSINDTVYDTVLALPQGSKKQFAVRIPKDCVSQTDGIVWVTLLDKKSNIVATKDFNRLLQKGADALTMGILSDEYPSLTYLDMGGAEVYCDGSSYPIKLTEVTQNTVMDSLDNLNILVVDSYDTAILTDEAAAAIERWYNNGGALIIGTGSRATETLYAFKYLNMQVVNIRIPESWNQDPDAYMDTSKLHIAELKDVNGRYYPAYGTLARISSQGNGAVGILPYALAEFGRLDASDYRSYEQEEIVKNLLEEVISSTGVPHGKYNYYTSNANSDNYLFANLLELFGNGSGSLHFGGLKLIVIIYVIFVGPVLYLILRLAKKRDFYWWTVPLAAVAGIFLVYWAGRGFEVVNTRVYSVTLENLSGEGAVTTYMHCYDANHKKWMLQLAEDYEYAGTSIDNYYGDRRPYYFIRQEGDRISFGANPVSSFEDCYFQACGSRDSGSGSIAGSIQKNSWGIAGTVVNNTSRDFAYFAVIHDGILYLYKNLPKGEICDLSSMKEIYSSDGNYNGVIRAYLYDHMREVCRSKERADVDILAALGVGIAAAYPEGMNKTMIIGVVKDWDKAVDDNCSETAYGCLYTIQ